VQTNLVWEHPEQNRQFLAEKLQYINDADIIVLPEMFSSGFTMNAQKVSESMQGKTVSWMKDWASRKNVAIVGSLAIEEHGSYYNRLLFVHPNGSIDSYDKRHTFTFAGEHNTYTSGSYKSIVDFKGWKICPLICYDLRFPVWARNVEDYYVLLYVANWPKVRMMAWDTLLRARAIENMSYCIGVNRIGLDGNNHEYSGNSAAYDALGNRLDSIIPDADTVEVVTLSKSELDAQRQKFNFLLDRDRFSLK